MIFRTAPADCWDLWGWSDFDGVEVSTLPLVDRKAGLFARCTYDDALAVARAHGASLMSTEVADAIHAKGFRLRPVILSPTSEMASEAWCLRHDQGVWQQLTAWDGRPVSNAGKDWIRDAPPGRSANYGWYDPKAPNGRMWQSLGTRHDRGHVDYSQLLRLVREKKPTGGHDLPPRPLGLRVVDVAKSYLGVTEKPGAQHDPTIQRFLAGARRGGTSTAGMFDDRSGVQTLGARPADETEWCISFATTCIAEALLPGDYAPCGRRAACWEAIADAKVRGRWHDVGSGYVPQDGDLELEGRNGQDPRRPGQQGHVGVRVGAQRVDGNSANTVRYVPAGGPKVVGWIQVSRMG